MPEINDDSKNIKKLFESIHRGDVEKMESLIREGVPVNINDKKLPSPGYTPLQWAIKRGMWVAYERLLHHGANINQVNSQGQTALHYAIAAGRCEAKSLEVTKHLIQKGADVNAVSGYNETPLSIAIDLSDIDKARLCLEAGAKPYALNRAEKEVPMHLLVKAAANANHDMVKLLLEHHFPLDECYISCGKTALHFAALRGELDIIESLVLAGADTDKKEAKGLTALDLARSRSNTAITDFLESVALMKKEKEVLSECLPLGLSRKKFKSLPL